MKKFLYFALSCAMVLGLASCQSEEKLYELTDSPEVSFMSESAIFKMKAEDGNKIAVTLYRGNTKGEVSVPVKITDGTDGVFTASKSTFDFADGENAAVIEFSYPDLNAFGGETYEIKIEVVNEEQVSPSGISECVVEATRLLTMKSLGTGVYYSDWYEEAWEQELTKAEEADYYELVDPWGTGVNFAFTVENGQINWLTVNSGYYNSTYEEYVMLGNQGITFENNIITMNTKYYISLGSFGTGIEQFQLPAGVKLF